MTVCVGSVVDGVMSRVYPGLYRVRVVYLLDDGAQVEGVTVATTYEDCEIIVASMAAGHTLFEGHRTRSAKIEPVMN
jgi:hypothetical protein